jgi:hypothetical protein
LEEVVRVVVRFVLGALIAGSIAGQTALAQGGDPKSGTYWLRKCTSPEAYGQIECANYVRALIEYDELRGKVLGQKRFFCPDKDVTLGQSRDIVVKYLRDRPQEQRRPFVLLAHMALEAAFSCSGKQPG